VRLLAGVLLACQLSGQTAVPNLCSVDGLVVNAATGEPVRKVKVSLWIINPAGGGRGPQDPPKPVATTTDAQGHFAFVNLDPGAYYLIAERDGFMTSRANPNQRAGPVQNLTLLAGDHKRDIAIKLIPLAALAGRILDEDGDPIQQIRVSAMVYTYTSKGRQLSERRNATTDDLGDYRIFNLEPGKYFLKAGPAGNMSRSGLAADDSYDDAYYPGTRDASSASPLELTAGAQMRGLDLTLHASRAAAIKGRVIKAAGCTWVGVGLATVNENGTSSSGSTVNDPDGKFEMHGVEQGPYILTGNCNAGDKSYTGQTPISVGSRDIEGIEIRLLASMELAGRVRYDGVASQKVPQLLISLNGDGPYGGVKGGHVGEDGAFTFQDVGPDVYHVSVNPPAGTYLKSIQFGTRDITDSGLDLTNGVGEGGLVVVLSTNGGTVDGNVTNGKSEPSASAIVTLVPSESHRTKTFYKTLATDAQGHFQIMGIAPGTYKIYAWDDVNVNAVLYDPDFVKPFEAMGQTLRISENDKQTVQLKLIKAPEEQ
jgi:protocatechuate 3,4-dioxygenase beta subunit